MADRLDRFVQTVAYEVVEPEPISYVIDKNYEVVLTSPTSPK
jgi:hypothetical protein